MSTTLLTTFSSLNFPLGPGLHYPTPCLPSPAPRIQYVWVELKVFTPSLVPSWASLSCSDTVIYPVTRAGNLGSQLDTSPSSTSTISVGFTS